MNRREILACLARFPYDRRDYWLVTGAAMVLYGIREETSDVDLGCTPALADRLEGDGFLYRIMQNGNRWFRFGEHVEIFESWLYGETLTLEGFQVISIDGLIAMKQTLGREKDIRDIELIRNHLAK